MKEIAKKELNEPEATYERDEQIEKLRKVLVENEKIPKVAHDRLDDNFLVRFKINLSKENEPLKILASIFAS